MVEPLSALLMIICSFTFRLCRASLCSLVRLSVFVCVMLGNLFDISFVVSSINVLRRGLGIGFVVAFEVVFFGMNLFRVFFGTGQKVTCRTPRLVQDRYRIRHLSKCVIHYSIVDISMIVPTVG